VYKRHFIALDAAVSVDAAKEIVSRDAVVREVILVKTNGVIALHFGRDQDPIELDGPTAFAPKGEDAEQGLYYSAAAQAGKSAVVIVVTGTKPSLNPTVRS